MATTLAYYYRHYDAATEAIKEQADKYAEAMARAQTYLMRLHDEGAEITFTENEAWMPSQDDTMIIYVVSGDMCACQGHAHYCKHRAVFDCLMAFEYGKVAWRM